jgi:hypothetical protein
MSASRDEVSRFDRPGRKVLGSDALNRPPNSAKKEY